MAQHKHRTIEFDGQTTRTSWTSQLAASLLMPALFPALLLSAEPAGCTQAGILTPLEIRLQAELHRIVEDYKLPGATAACFSQDDSPAMAASGLADLEKHIAMTPDTPMLAASIGKMFVSATVISLIEDGLLSPDLPIRTWLGERTWFSRLPNHDSVTLRHLLTHSAGLPNHVESEEFIHTFRKISRTDSLMPPEALVAFILDRPALFPAGQGWHYSDTGYILLGLIIENVTGESCFDLIGRRFLKPLNLSHTSPSNKKEIHGLAAGYTGEDNPLQLPEKSTVQPGVMAWHPGIEWAGGGLASTSGDLARWALALFSGEVLTEAGTALLLETVTVSHEPAIEYGLGVSVHRGGSHGPAWGHSGWVPGYCSNVSYYPDHGVAIAFQINTDRNIMGNETPVMERIKARLAAAVINFSSESIEK